MRILSLSAVVCSLVFAGCTKMPEYSENNITPQPTQEEIAQNVQNIFGTTFSPDQDWSTTKAGSVTITANAALDNIAKVQILTGSPFGNKDANGSEILNEAAVTVGQKVTLTYDTPSDITRLYAACVSSDGKYFIKGFDPGQATVEFNSLETNASHTRGVSADLLSGLPEPQLGNAIASFNKQNGSEGWENDMLYPIKDVQLKNYTSVKGETYLPDALMLILNDYDSDFKNDLRNIIFEYLPNKGLNVEKIRKSDFFNENCYAITTGKNEPIVLSPVYYQDGGVSEFINCDIYYYYFKESDLKGKDALQYIKSLPKYMAAELRRTERTKYKSTGLPRDVIKKETGYPLIYWGDGIPTKDTKGSFYFPEGYKIGFFIHAKKTDQQGELYCDGRLNKEINTLESFNGKTNKLRNSGLSETDPRMVWIGVNGKNYLLGEPGTDSDFNDMIIEVEGGIVTFDSNIEVPNVTYTYCFEDRLDGDYDMNDVVIKAKRINQTQIMYSLEACGAYDELYLKNINGDVLNDVMEIHAMFNADQESFINTEGGNSHPPIREIIEVSPTFSMASIDPSEQIYIYNKTYNRNIYLSRLGEDPHAILIPYDYKYPLEKNNISKAYKDFVNWGMTPGSYHNWYKNPENGEVYTLSVFKDATLK